LPGCLSPLATQPALNPGTSRAALLRRQLLYDSARELACRPCRTSWQLLVDPPVQICFVSRGLVGKTLLPLAGAPKPLQDERPTLDPVVLEKQLQQVTGRPLEMAHLELFTEGKSALVALERLINSASERIDVLMYLWESDVLGQAVAEHLARAGRNGIAVRVLVDGGGNLIHSHPEKTTVDQVNRVVNWLAQQPNVQVFRTRNPLARFDHRKLMVIDGRVAWTGGRNFTRPAFFEDRDLSVTIEGPLVHQLTDCFELYWSEQGGHALVQQTGRTPPSTPPVVAPDSNAWARIVSTGPGEHNLAKTLFCAVSNARHHIYVENPYLCDSRLVCELAWARRRGVDVRVILATNCQCDLIDHASRITINRLLSAGIRVYRHPATTHVKALSVDGVWAYLGTGNFDTLSLHRNHELGLAISSGPVIGEIEERLFQLDCRPEWELTKPVPLFPGDRMCDFLSSLCL
jgi:cardiolipin synthase